MNKKYKCIFFDLDHTLWDYETNSQETLGELFHRYSLKEKGVDTFESFLFCFREVNARLWDLYDRGVITSDVIRKERFDQILASFGIRDEKFSRDLSVEYLDSCPKKGKLMPNALETLEYLSGNYNLTIVTNGFEEVQHVKLSSGKVDHFFDHIITSQKAGHKKPAKEIFEFAMKMNDIQFHEAIMIGDNLITDMGGARNAGIDTVYFNPYSVAHRDDVKHEIQDLKELCSFL